MSEQSRAKSDNIQVHKPNLLRRFLKGEENDHPAKMLERKTPKILMIAGDSQAVNADSRADEAVLTEDIFRLWRKQGVDAWYLAISPDDDGQGRSAIEACSARERVFVFHGGEFDDFSLSCRNTALLYQNLARFLVEIQPEVVHFHQVHGIGVEALKLVRRVLPGVRIVYTVYDEELLAAATSSDVNNVLRMHYIQTHLDVVDHFVAGNKRLADLCIRWGIAAEHISVIENGSAEISALPPRRREGRSAKKRNYFSCIGPLIPDLGVDTLLDAVDYLLKENYTQFRVDIYSYAQGPSSRWYGFEQEIKQRILDNKHYLTYTPLSLGVNMRSALERADWLVSPVKTSGVVPLGAYEALQARRPIICSAASAVEDLVVPGVNGLSFVMRDHKELAEIMYSACEQQAVWDRLRQKMKSGAFTQLQTAERYRMLYERMGASNHNGAASV